MNKISNVLLKYIEDNRTKHGITYIDSITALEDLLNEIKHDYRLITDTYKVIVYNEVNLLIDFQTIEATSKEDAREIYLLKNNNIIKDTDKIVIE